MTTQPEALRLAAVLDCASSGVSSDGWIVAGHIDVVAAAAELRQLHAELAATERQAEILSDDLSRCSKLNRKLLKALKEIADAGIGSVAPGYAEIARAAIAKAEGEHT